jgi:hypothetical protein
VLYLLEHAEEGGGAVAVEKRERGGGGHGGEVVEDAGGGDPHGEARVGEATDQGLERALLQGEPHGFVLLEHQIGEAIAGHLAIRLLRALQLIEVEK